MSKINLEEPQRNRNATANFVNLIRTSTVNNYWRLLDSGLYLGKKWKTATIHGFCLFGITTYIMSDAQCFWWTTFVFADRLGLRTAGGHKRNSKHRQNTRHTLRHDAQVVISNCKNNYCLFHIILSHAMVDNSWLYLLIFFRAETSMTWVDVFLCTHR